MNNPPSPANRSGLPNLTNIRQQPITKSPITMALQFIQLQDIVRLQSVLSLIDLTNVSEFDQFRMANFLLEMAQKSNAVVTIPIILDKFKLFGNIGNMQTEINFITYLFGQLFFTDTVLVFTINAITSIKTELPDYDIQEYDYTELLDDLVSIGRVLWVPVALSRAERIFGPQDHGFYKVYYELLSEKGDEYLNSELGQFIIERYKETNDFAPIPPWVKNFDETSKDIPHEDEFDMNEIEEEWEENIQAQIDNIYETNSIEELIARGMEGFKSMGIEEESLVQIKQQLEKDLKSKSKEEWHELLDEAIYQEVRRQMVNDIGLFRLYGPVHPIANQHLDTDSMADKFGGCRLFLCDIFDYDPDDETNILDWFTGSCDFCHRKIRVRWHAVRRPKLTGGWQGCYCSWDHVEQDLVHNEQVVLPLLDVFENVMNQNGIQDRSG